MMEYFFLDFKRSEEVVSVWCFFFYVYTQKYSTDLNAQHCFSVESLFDFVNIIRVIPAAGQSC